MTIKAFKQSQPELGRDVYVDDSAVIIGDVSLGNNVSIWPTAVVRGDVERIRIGEDTNVQDGAVLHVSHAGPFSSQSHPLTIGKGVTIGHRATVHAATIGDYCLIGIGAIILDGVILEDYVMLGAGALVTSGKKLLSGYLYVGAPARQIRPLTDAERKFLEYSAEHYVLLKNQYLHQD